MNPRANARGGTPEEADAPVNARSVFTSAADARSRRKSQALFLCTCCEVHRQRRRRRRRRPERPGQRRRRHQGADGRVLGRRNSCQRNRCRAEDRTAGAVSPSREADSARKGTDHKGRLRFQHAHDEPKDTGNPAVRRDAGILTRRPVIVRFHKVLWGSSEDGRPDDSCPAGGPWLSSGVWRLAGTLRSTSSFSGV